MYKPDFASLAVEESQVYVGSIKGRYKDDRAGLFFC